MKNYIIELEGKKVSYYIEGDPEKPLIVCLHGLAGSAAYSFSTLSEKLSNDFQLLLIDQPGHGKSTAFNREEDYLFSNLASWYEKVFDSIIDRPFYLLGHSWGADVALHYARYYSENIKGVILLDGAFTFPQFQEDMTFTTAYNGWDSYIDNAKYNTWEEIVNEYRTYTKHWNETIEQSVTSIFKKNNNKYELTASKFTVLSIIKAFFDEPFTSAYPFIQSRLLLLHSTEPEELNGAREKGITQLKEDIKDVSIIRLEETGHMIQWDQPVEVSAEILRWTNNMEKR
ncbi:alpha/beta fold hydrolase [Neobacillus niacini]|uniref:alpha/beta fold hydrolase n=1 Tax=Neobacillus niacini TaxID=86668 RepID=UPI003B02E9DA